MHRHLQRLRYTMYKQGLDLGRASAMLMWVMTANPETNEVENWDRILLLTRLRRIHIGLSERLQLQIEESLMDFISAGGENMGFLASEFDPEGIQLRRHARAFRSPFSLPTAPVGTIVRLPGWRVARRRRPTSPEQAATTLTAIIARAYVAHVTLEQRRR